MPASLLIAGSTRSYKLQPLFWVAGSLRGSVAAPRPTEGRVSGGVPFTGAPIGALLACATTRAL